MVKKQLSNDNSGPHPIQLASTDTAMPVRCMLYLAVGGQLWRLPQSTGMFVPLNSGQNCRRISIEKLDKIGPSVR